MDPHWKYVCNILKNAQIAIFGRGSSEVDTNLPRPFLKVVMAFRIKQGNSRGDSWHLTRYITTRKYEKIKNMNVETFHAQKPKKARAAARRGQSVMFIIKQS